jgi:MFS family permease
VSTGPTEPRWADDRLVLAFVCATAFAVVLNGTMLPVALPEIGEALSLGPVALGWIITGYFLVNGVAIPFFGRLADLHGVDHLYTIGLAVFFFGSFPCVVAPNFALLMAGRLVQGAGAAAVVGLGPRPSAWSSPRRGGAVLWGSWAPPSGSGPRRVPSWVGL